MIHRFFQTRLTRSAFKKRRVSLLSALESVRSDLALTGAALREFQAERLRHLLRHAWENVPFYRKKYQAAGFEPDQFGSLDDLHRIPVLTKEELRGAEPEALRAGDGEREARLLSTSGSTGIPVSLWRCEESLWRFTAAAMVRFHGWCRGEPIRNVLYVLDDVPHNIDYALADQLRTMSLEDRFVSSSARVEEVRDAVDRFQPEYISSYPSTLRNLAWTAARRGETFPSVRLLNLTSEMLDRGTRERLGSVFPEARIVETYTSTEAGFMGAECLDRGGFHLAEEMVLMEPEAGLVTDLHNRATPVIRYSGLGDLMTRAAEPCRCGSEHVRIEQLQGRRADSVVRPDGTLVTPYALTNILAGEPGVYKYQIIQQEIRSFRIRVVFGPDRTEKPAEMGRRLESAFQRALGAAVRCELEPVEDILPPPGRHKVPLVVSRIGEG